MRWLAIKAVFFDIDGTLLTDKRTVSKSTISAINSLKAKGILIGLATGRDPRFVLPYMASLGLDLAITYNGQYIFSREELIYSRVLDPSQVESMMNYAQRHHKDLALGTAKGVFGSGIMSTGTGNFAYRVSRLIPDNFAGLVNFIFNRLVRLVRPQRQTNLRAYLAQPIYQLMMLTTERETRELEARFTNLSFTRSSPYATDIISKGSSKLSGILKVAEKYRFSLDEVVAFGDSNNDFEMLKALKYSVAMGNGTKRVRQIASLVTDSNNRDGIYKAFVRLGLLEEKDVSE